MIGIYKITSPTGRIYIGQSNNIEKRLNGYRFLKCKTQPLLYRSLIKYGVKAHIFETVEECEISSLNERERYYQELFNCLNNGLNCCLVSTKDKKFVHSDITKSKISKSRTGIKFTDEHLANMSKCNLGKKTSQKTKEILRQKSLSAGCKPPSWKGKVKTKGHLQKIADKLRGRSRTQAEKLNTSKAMLNLILPYSDIIFDPHAGVYYNSIRDAARTQGMTNSSFRWLLKSGKTHFFVSK